MIFTGGGGGEESPKLEYECFVCRGMLNSGMCQSGIVIEGGNFPAHIFCADKWASEEIDVWQVVSPGNGSYYECSVHNVTEAIKEMDNDSEYVIRKERMTNALYHALPEFQGF